MHVEDQHPKEPRTVGATASQPADPEAPRQRQAAPSDVEVANEKLIGVRKDLADRVAESAAQLQRLGDAVATAVGLTPVRGDMKGELDDMGSKLYVAGVHQLELASAMVRNVQKLADRLLDTIDSSAARVLRIIVGKGEGGHVFFDFRNTTMGTLGALEASVEPTPGQGFDRDDFEVLLGRDALAIGQATSVCVQLKAKDRPSGRCNVEVSIKSGKRVISSRDVEVWVRA
jgi:hypothetical protein